MAENTQFFPKVEYVLFDMDGARIPSLQIPLVPFSPVCLGLMIDSEKIYTDVTSQSHVSLIKGNGA